MVAEWLRDPVAQFVALVAAALALRFLGGRSPKDLVIGVILSHRMLLAQGGAASHAESHDAPRSRDEFANCSMFLSLPERGASSNR